ncbi:DUF6596 domain-containing protein [Hwangdonia lutea]|uniref:DUF6596 domain-containing protein n=1 Tax=Hwangdonia lutea TaxID=3075823 RepID=A0AA97HQ51_9FLAO|nr:DUF6596 domain-containing protein [Hwangdonia sp. SCSIO 19198]WOD42328.1 DUF6596 domain-containing protein [Hwangdonia sp. SCSIO 19198]
MRARKTIQQSHLKFQIPQGKALQQRLESVMEVLYLIFNEGFHSNKPDILIRKELCGEAMRLTQMLLKNELTRTPEVYALYTLMCFHSARLETKTNAENELLDLKNQDRTQWYFPLIKMGNSMMNKAVVEQTTFSCYHYEAAIASEHLRAKTFEDTDWDKIHYWYQCLNALQPMPIHVLNMAVVCIQNRDLDIAKTYLDDINAKDFEQRAYLFYGAQAEYFIAINKRNDAIKYLDLALNAVNNSLEKEYLQKKKLKLLKHK